MWVWQKAGCEVGNTVVMTPALQAMSSKLGRPIPVLFDSPHVAELYRDCQFIEHLATRPVGSPMFTSANNPHDVGNRTVTDFYFQEYAVKRLGYTGAMPPWYTDTPEVPAGLPSGPKMAIIHGCLGLGLRGRKNMGDAIRLRMLQGSIDAGFTPVLIGSRQDWKWFWKAIESKIPEQVVCIIDRPIREALGAALACDGVICNDTGMSHVLAGAHEKHTLILGGGIEREWVHPYRHVTYCHAVTEHERAEAITSFLQKRKRIVTLPPVRSQKRIGLSFQVPYAPRQNLSEPHAFLQQMLRTYLCDQHDNKELRIGVEHSDLTHIDTEKEEATARKACRSWMAGDTPIVWQACNSGIVAHKRNAMMNATDRDWVVTRDADDLYSPRCGKLIALYLEDHPECRGHCSDSLVGYFDLSDRNWGYVSMHGSGLYVHHIPTMRACGLEYPDQRQGADDTLHKTIRVQYPELFAVSNIPNIGSMIIVLRLKSGHLSRQLKWKHCVGKDATAEVLYRHVAPPVCECIDTIFKVMPVETPTPREFLPKPFVQPRYEAMRMM